jgi:hypothetical protein
MLWYTDKRRGNDAFFEFDQEGYYFGSRFSN